MTLPVSVLWPLLSNPKTDERLTTVNSGLNEAKGNIGANANAIAQEVAKDLMRYDKAVESVKDSSKDWEKALKSGAEI